MPRRSIRSTFALLAAMGSVLVFACSDSTAPITARIPGTYELTTVLDSYTYSNACTPTDAGLMCTDTTVAAGASKLYGTFTLGDTVQGTWKAFQFPVTDIVLHQADCARSTTECSEQLREWRFGSLTVTRDSLTTTGILSGEVQIYLTGQLVGDRIAGDISWATYLGCCAVKRYVGTFVATRQP